MDTGDKCGPNVEGELYVKTPYLTLGYIGISNDKVFDSDGFFKTGDIGYYDSEGLLYFSDRLKDLIKVGLQHVYPAEVESVLQSHPDVAAVSSLLSFKSQLETQLFPFNTFQHELYLEIEESIPTYLGFTCLKKGYLPWTLQATDFERIYIYFNRLVSLEFLTKKKERRVQPLSFFHLAQN